MKPWIYLVLCLQILNTVVNGDCPKEKPCELREWVQWDCTNCCTMTAAQGSAVRKRKICCPEHDDLPMCLLHCNISTDRVEKKGPCKDNCKCPSTPTVLTKTPHAAGVSEKYTRNNVPTLHMTMAFRTLSTDNPGKQSSRTAVPSTVTTQNSNSSTTTANPSTAGDTMDSGRTKITNSPVFISLLVLGILVAISAGIIAAHWFWKRKKRQVDATQGDLTVPDLTNN